MSETTDIAADLAAFEAQFADQLTLSPDAQDLLFRAARTAHSFADEPVTDEQVRAIYELIEFAPTSANSQPLRAVFVRSAEARQRLLPSMAEGNREKTGAAPLVAVLAADTDFHLEMPRIFPGAGEGMQQMFAENEDARHRAARLSASLQIGYFILGVRAAGLAAGPMTGFDAPGLSAEFFPDGKHEALVVVNIGKPSEDAYRPRNPRLSFDEVATIL